MRVIRVILGAIIVASAAYVMLFTHGSVIASTPLLGQAKLAWSGVVFGYSWAVAALVTWAVICPILVVLIFKVKRHLTLFLSFFACVSLICLLSTFIVTGTYYYTPEGGWQEPEYPHLNYPEKGGVYSSVPKPLVIELEDGSILEISSKPGKEIELLNLIGKEGSGGFPQCIAKNTNTANLESFGESFVATGLNEVCDVTIILATFKSALLNKADFCF